jgi:hypothetical protein
MTKETIDIHGKKYETVASRVSRFREKHSDEYSIITELVSADTDRVVMKATISKDGNVIATGYAEENRNASTINRTSALENCETSAIGRALAAYGMAGTEYASADELTTALRQQSSTIKPVISGQASDKQRQLIAEKLAHQGITLEQINGYLIEQYGVTIPLTKEGATFVIDDLLGN